MTLLLHVLQHALGRDQYGKRRHSRTDDYRNHYCIGPEGDTFDLCRSAVALGLMVEHAPRAISGDMFTFTVTDAGKAYIDEHSPPAPKLTRGQRRYREWLNGPADSMSFGEWIRR